jgi:glutamate racemase
VLVSSADETAFEVRARLDDPHERRRTARPARHAFLTSGDIETFRTLGARFLGPEVDTVEAWRWT